MQLLPSPEYPGLQVQLWDPSVLLQKALMSQLCLFVVHSSISMKESSQREKGKCILPSSLQRNKGDAASFEKICSLSQNLIQEIPQFYVYKQRKTKTRHYPCNYFHLQSIQAYRCNYEIPRYYYRKHWCHNYACYSYTRQYLWRKVPSVRKVGTFHYHLH